MIVKKFPPEEAGAWVWRACYPESQHHFTSFLNRALGTRAGGGGKGPPVPWKTPHRIGRPRAGWTPSSVPTPTHKKVAFDLLRDLVDKAYAQNKLDARSFVT